MNPLTFAITPDISGLLYDAAAHLALTVFLLMLCWEGHRRQFPAAAWLLALAIIITAACLGSRIAVFDVAAWQTWWQQGSFPVATERTSIGVVIFLFPAIWFIKKGLRFQEPFLDTLAFALPVVVMIRRLGCLAAACCYGLPTDGGWGLRFLGPSPIRDQHWAAGIAGADRYGTAAVHPVQLYFIAGALLCLFMLYKNRKHFQRSGNLTLWSLVLLLGFRFFIEFFRDPMSNHQLGYTLLGLKQIQWFLLVVVLLLTLVIYIRERKAEVQLPVFERPSLARIFVVNILLTLFVFSMQDSFLPSEKTGIHTFQLLSGLALLYSFIRQHETIPRLKWQTALVSLLAVFMMSQSYPDQMYKVEDGKIRTLHANWNKLNFNEPTYNCIEIASGCGGDYCALADSLRPNGAQYQSFDLGYNVMDFYTQHRKRVRPGQDSTIQSYLEYGVDFQPELFYDESNDFFKFRSNLMPYIGWGDDFVGFRGGFRIGSIWGRRSIFNDIEQAKSLVLAGSLRLGNPDVFYFRFDLDNSLAIGASASTFETSLTFNLNDYTGNRWKYLRIGLGDVNFRSGRMYLEPSFNLTPHFILTPRAGITYRQESRDNNKKAFHHPSIGLGLHYHFK